MSSSSVGHEPIGFGWTGTLELRMQPVRAGRLTLEDSNIHDNIIDGENLRRIRPRAFEHPGTDFKAQSLPYDYASSPVHIVLLHHQATHSTRNQRLFPFGSLRLFIFESMFQGLTALWRTSG